MEQLLGFALVVIVISVSGVMSPGPLFAANVFYGLKGGTKAGLKMAYGHTVVELPLVILLGIGAFSLDTIPEFRTYIAIIGSIGLFVFAGIQLKQIYKNRVDIINEPKHGPFLAGILLSALNPFFITWWLTIGFKLISDALIIWSFWGILIMFGLHIWMDYVWLSSTALVSSRISKILSNRNFKFLVVGLSVVLIYFGITFLIDVFV
ncbi:MAG TPA: LysE family transporter [Nitrosopumilaceae archaeon]|nr:LysE family transporter [Nitrosopumilaceae archaeon]